MEQQQDTSAALANSAAILSGEATTEAQQQQQQQQSLSKGKKLLSIRERASGLRRKKTNKLNTSTAAATENSTEMADLSIEQSNSGNAEGNSNNTTTRAKAALSQALSKANGTSEAANEDGKQQQQGQSTLDVLTKDISSVSKYGIESSMFSELKDLFWLITTRVRRSGSLSPQGLIVKLKQTNELFRSNAHQDAHELLNHLLNQVVENLQKISADKELSGCTGAPLDGPNQYQGNTWLHTLFEGSLTNETRCLSCETVTSRDETFLDVSVDIHENSSVTSCLNQFAAGELLRHNNKFHCDSCGGLQEAERRMRLKRLPNILALHLKRFKFHEVLGRDVKLSYRVNFPVELRVPNTTEETEDILYSLSSIVVHLGGGPLHGHYISIVRSGDKWILFDDDCVEIIKENELSNYFGDFPNFGSGYVLFYERTDFDPMQYDLPRPFPVPQATADTNINTALPTRVQTDGLHESHTMPNLASSSGVDKFAAPTRPPPLISTTRSIHGSLDPGQLSPGSPATPHTPHNPMGGGFSSAAAAAAGVNGGGSGYFGHQPGSVNMSSCPLPSHTTSDQGKARGGGRSWFSRRNKK